MPTDKYEELLTTFDAESLREVHQTAAQVAAAGTPPSEIAWGWDHPAEIYFHPFDPTALRDELTAYLADRAEVYEIVQVYKEYGSFRDTEAGPDAAHDQHDHSFHGQQPQQCFYNAQTNAGPDFTYVEGYVTAPATPHPMPHAWLERDGTVVELTFPDGQFDRSVYYGVPYDYQTVATALVDREHAAPLASEPDTYPPQSV